MQKTTDKKELRRLMRARRNALSEAEVLAASVRVHERFMDAFGDRNRYLLYLGTGGEIATRELVHRLYGMGRDVYLPVLEGGGVGVGLYCGEDCLVTCKYGIYEPDTRCDDDSFDVVVVPGVAFTPQGARLGSGSGYYDRLLPMISTPATVGFAHEFQVVDHIETEPFDRSVDIIMTENTTYRRHQ